MIDSSDGLYPCNKITRANEGDIEYQLNYHNLRDDINIIYPIKLPDGTNKKETSSDNDEKWVFFSVKRSNVENLGAQSSDIQLGDNKFWNILDGSKLLFIIFQGTFM